MVTRSAVPRLLADIGGTNARFAWQAGPGAEIEPSLTLPCAQYPTVADAIRAFLARCERPQPLECAIAIANPVVGDRVQMTNHHWSFSIAELQQTFGWQRLRVFNDFTGLALALPLLSDADKRAVGSGRALPNAPIGLVGPGTGLGVSGLLPDGKGGWVPLQGEGGHVSLSPASDREALALDALIRRFGHASAERAVSGQGLENLYHALREADGQPATVLGAPEIGQRALDNLDPHAVEALDMFCAFLGSVAGNLALTLGAKGGVYIGGGIVPRWGTRFDASPFRRRFEAKGRFQAYLSDIPVWVIQARQSPALLGAACALDAAEPTV